MNFRLEEACWIFKPYQKSEFRLPKWHAMAHYELAIIAYGNPMGQSTGPYEKKHVGAIKSNAKFTNRKGSDAQVGLMHIRGLSVVLCRARSPATEHLFQAYEPSSVRPGTAPLW